MKTIGLAAILALTSTAAFAGGFQFSLDGGTVSIDLDDNCSDRLCASVSWQERGSRERRQFRLPEISTKTISKYIDVPKSNWKSSPADDENDAEDSDEPSSKPSTSRRQSRESDEPAAAPQAKRVPRVERETDVEREPQPPTSFRQPAAVATPAPAPAEAGSPGRGSASAPSVARAPASEPSTPPAERSSAPESRVAAVAPKSPDERATKPSRPTPVGEWLVEDGEGKIRIEECGANMCGYVSAAKNPNEKDRHNPDPALRSRPVIGTPILVNMKPDGKRWSGRIYNVKDGRSYTAHISLKNADTLRVEGCAFGGMICGGQNWSRVD